MISAAAHGPVPLPPLNPLTAVPVPVVELHLRGQGLQGDAAVVPEGDARHLLHQILQLALQLPGDGEVVRVLGVLHLQVLQVPLHRLVEGERTLRHLRAVGGSMVQEMKSKKGLRR